MMKCADDFRRVHPMYAVHRAFFDSAVSAQRNERSRVDRA